MKKNIIYIFLIIFSVFAFSDVSYRTYTLGPKGYITETRTAFVPEKVLKPSVLNAEDLFIDNQNNLYIADTGNMRLLKIYQDGSEESFGDFEVFMPTGIYVKNNKIYVADSGNFSVAVYDENGFLIKTIEKPSEPLFGIKNLFIPLKIAVDNRENIYIVNEGSTNGLVNLNSEGNFMNYFAANQPDVSLKMILQRIIYSGNNNFLKIKPPSPTNLTIDKDGLIYTTTYGQENDGIKKFDIAGNNILSGKIFSSSDIVDVATDRDNNIYALTSEGYIFISNSVGDLLFIFGGKESDKERIGLLKNPSAIDVSEDRHIYILDKEKNIITVFRPTEFAEKIFEGDNYYIQGLYTQGKEIWNEIRNLNSSFILSYKALAKAYFKEKDYKKALEYFKISGEKKEYSEAFWQIRNEWLQSNLSGIIVILIVLYLLLKIIGITNKKYNYLNGIQNTLKKTGNIKIFSDLKFTSEIIKDPFDSYYMIKRKNRIDIKSATVLYIYLFVLEVAKIFLRGFIFSDVNNSHINLFAVMGRIYIPFILFILSNYLVSEINNGEGKLKDIYIGSVYALTPYLIFEPFLIIISNVLTFNESFFYTIPEFVIISWSIILVIIMIKEIHNYTLGETVKNILLTAFTAFMIIIIIFIIFVLITQEFDFVQSVVREMIIND